MIDGQPYLLLDMGREPTLLRLTGPESRGSSTGLCHSTRVC